jgi:prolyl oligopeptidase
MKPTFAARLGPLALASLSLAAGIVAPCASARAQVVPATAPALKYPATPRGNQADDLNGVRVADPYRWLESMMSSDVRNWVTAQNAVTTGYFAQLPKRRDVRDIVERAWNYAKVSAPFAAGERLFFFENGGIENQPVLYVQERFDAIPRMLIDPNAFSSDGLVAIVDQAASPEGRYLAYATSTQGSSWRVVRIRDVRTGMDVDDRLQGVKSSPLSWTRDERGFFYVRVDQGAGFSALNPLVSDGRQRVYYHRIGRPQSDDQLIYENAENPSLSVQAEVSEDGHYLVLTLRAGTELHNRISFIDLDNPKRPNLGAPLVKLFDNPDALYEFVASEGNIFYFRTTKDAPRARLVGVDINMPDPNYWTTAVRETFDPLIAVRRVNDRFVAHRLHDSHSLLELYSFDGGARGTVQLPSIGTVTEINPRPESRDFFFTFTSFLSPPAAFRYDLDTRSAFAYREPRADSTLARYETTQLFYTSKDGTRVPMFITARRGITLDGTHATLLTGGVGFNVAMSPMFSPEVAAWLNMGGIYVVANVRGGGEDGRRWHDAAAGARKGVAVDDLLSAADFLINQRYTRAGMLGVSGQGHSATLAAAAIAKRPELFAAALLDAGVYDLSRFNRFTVGPTWVPEYGSPDRPAELKALLAYSPLQNVDAERAYPATLISVGDHDDVATPVHSYKFAAALQNAQRGAAPVLLRIEYDAGPGVGTPTAKQIALATDRLAFLANAIRPPR